MGETGAVGGRVPARDLGTALVAAAAALVAEAGPGGVSLRAIARRCGVSHAAPAHHFADRAGLFSALAAEGFRGLAAALVAVPDEPGRRRLAAMGVAYVTYAASVPGHFPVMFRPELFDATDHALVEARRAAYTALEQGVVDARADGWARGADHDTAVVTAWAAVHGLATLWFDGNLPGRTTDDLDSLATAAATLLIGAGG